jgi:hypothetical protein
MSKELRDFTEGFCAEFPRLEVAQQERFRAVVTRLLAGQVLNPGPALKPDPDWRFAERQRDLIDAYLRIGGWRFEFDAALRIGRAVHGAGEQRVRFNKLESMVLVLLRLMYHESMQRAGGDDDDGTRCEVTVGDVRERLVQAGRAVSTLSRRALDETVRRLHRHSLVHIARGFTADDRDVIRVEPVIESVLPPDRIAELAARLRAYATGDNDAPLDDALDDAEDAATRARGDAEETS